MKNRGKKIMDNKDEYVWEITGTTAIDDTYVEEELKREAKAFASGKGKNTGFCLRGLCGQDVSKIDMVLEQIYGHIL